MICYDMLGTLTPSLPEANSMAGFVRDCCRQEPKARIPAALLARQLRAARDRACPPKAVERSVSTPRQLTPKQEFPPPHARVLLADDVALNSKARGCPCAHAHAQQAHARAVHS